MHITQVELLLFSCICYFLSNRWQTKEYKNIQSFLLVFNFIVLRAVMRRISGVMHS